MVETERHGRRRGILGPAAVDGLGARSRFLPITAATVLALLWVGAAWAGVYLNEMTIRPVGVPELVELYNSGPDTTVAGWTISGNKGSFTIPGPASIPVGGYFVVTVGDIMEERGGVTSLIDLDLATKRGSRTVRDAVAYGQEGSAPLPPAGMSLARAPDASFGAPPAPDPDLDGLVWTIDPTPTFGAINDAPTPELGSSLRLNEICPGEIGGQDFLELYNPLPNPVFLGEWTLINGDAAEPLNGLVPPFGFFVVQTLPGFDLEEVGLLYLFRDDGVRVDQIAFHDAPLLEPGQSYSRCPDGAAPFLGYTYLTSGGGHSFFPLPTTLGISNGDACSGTPVEIRSWGRIKEAFHRPH